MKELLLIKTQKTLHSMLIMLWSIWLVAHIKLIFWLVMFQGISSIPANQTVAMAHPYYSTPKKVCLKMECNHVIPKYALRYRENIRSVSTRWKKTKSFPRKILIHDFFIFFPSTIGGPTDWFHLTTPQFIGSLCMVSSKLLREIAARCHHKTGLRPILLRRKA